MGKDKLEWVSASGGSHPGDSVRAGYDSGETVYVARAHHEGAIVPGKLHNGHNVVYIPYNMTEVLCPNYEVLTGPPAALSWIDGANGEIPPNAVQGGMEPDGEVIYIGRAIHNGTVTVGKVHESHGCCYVSYGGEELNFKQYEILVKNKLGVFLGC